MPLQATRTNPLNGAIQIFRLVTLTDGSTHYSAALDRTSPLVLAVYRGEPCEACFTGLFDLDGKPIEHYGTSTWALVRDANTAPPDVLAVVGRLTGSPPLYVEAKLIGRLTGSYVEAAPIGARSPKPTTETAGELWMSAAVAYLQGAGTSKTGSLAVQEAILVADVLVEAARTRGHLPAAQEAKGKTDESA